MRRREAISRLAGVSFGRVVFTDGALPAIRPVNHLVVDDAVIIRTHLGSAVSSLVHASGPGVVLAYEADEIDTEQHVGWSVVVTGMAGVVDDANDVRRYERLLIPWVNNPMNQVIRIDPDIVTGFWLTSAGPTGDGSAPGDATRHEATPGDATRHEATHHEAAHHDEPASGDWHAASHGVG